MIKVTLDFETRSLVELVKGKIPQTTQDRYAADPSTEVLCLAYKVDDGGEEWWAPKRVTSALSLPERSLSALRKLAMDPDVLFEAHNAPFEMAIWKHIMVLQLNMPPIPIERWRCSAAKAAMHGLPRGLGAAAEAMGLPAQKDKGGHALMLSMCKPKAPLKADYVRLAEELGQTPAKVKSAHLAADMRDRWYSAPDDKKLIVWKEDPKSLRRLIDYCKQDVRAEHGLSHRLEDLPDVEQKVWFLDQKINGRGLPIDLEAVEVFIEFCEYAMGKLLSQFSEATRGAVTSPKQYSAFAQWISSKGVPCTSVNKKSLTAIMSKKSTPEEVRIAVRLAQQTNKSSVSKYSAMVRGAEDDLRVRGTMLYHGAGTGREAGKLVQPQNLPRGDFADVDLCVQLIKRREFALVESLFGDALHIASTCIRGMIHAPEGKEFLCADFNAVEGRVFDWLADDQPALDVYREGKCPYCAVASRCFGVPYEEIYSGYLVGDKAMARLRSLGKVGSLAAQFGGGQGAVLQFAPDMEYSDRVDIVTRWRAARPLAKRFWYALTDAAADAMQTPMKAFSVGKVAYLYNPTYGFLICRLPSGRKIYYPSPELVVSDIGPGVAATRALDSIGVEHRFSAQTVWADEDRQIHLRDAGGTERVFPKESIGVSPLWIKKNNRKVTAWTVDSKQSGSPWAKRDLSHLILSENVTQATARDLLIQQAFVKLEGAGYPIILQVHDEAMAEVDEGSGSVEEFERLMCDLPDWAEGLPIKAEGWRGKRFKK